MTTPRITAVEVVSHGVLQVTWNDRETLSVDISDMFGAKGPAGKLREPKYFGKVTIGDGGRSVDWPNDFGIGADTLYCDARAQAGLSFPTADFNAWMKRHGLTFDAAAKALGLSRRMVAYYNIGARPIPKMVGLACKGWEVENRRRKASKAA